MTAVIIPAPHTPQYRCDAGHESYSTHACLTVCPLAFCGQPVTRVRADGRRHPRQNGAGK